MVLWWLNEFPPDPGGIATIAGLLRPALDERFDMVMLVTQGGPSDEMVGRTRLIRRRIWEDFRSEDLRRQTSWVPFVRELKAELAPDVYHVHLADPIPILHLLTLQVAPAPTVLTVHVDTLASLLDAHGGGLFGRLLDLSTVTIAVATATAESLVRHRPERADRIVVIPNGVPIGAEPTPPTAEPRLLAMGRLVEQKGFDRLLRALPTVVEAVPEVRLTIAGDGVARPALAALASELGIADHVHFPGHVSREQVGRLLAEARVVALPSRFEGMPLVALEAGERGRCVVGTDVGGVNEVIVDGVTGLLVEESTLDSDPRPLAAALIRSLVEPGLAERLGAAARRRVVERFSVDACADAHALVYRQVSSSAPHPRVSVLIPAHNAARFVQQALATVAAQDFDDLEIIVVDDGSEDDTAALSEAVDDPRVVVLRQPHRGVGSTRNAALALARGAYIAHLDADDLWPEGRLSRMVAALDLDPSLDAVFGLAREFAEPDAPTSALVMTEPQQVRMVTAGLIRREAHRRIGPFDGGGGDQLDWSMRALAAGLRYSQVDDLVLLRRIHGGNMSHARPFTEDRSRIAVLKKAMDLRRQQESGGSVAGA